MVIVVGGHARNIGKTSVVCGVIRALPHWNWTAIKITQHAYGLGSQDGRACVSEENEPSASTDSGRFLASGASRAFWVRAPAGTWNDVMPGVRDMIDAADHTIVESNSILEFLKPDLFAMVLDGSVADFKATSLRFLDRANALVVTSEAPLTWAAVPPALLQGRHRFSALPPSYRSAEFIELIDMSRRPVLKTSATPADILHR